MKSIVSDQPFTLGLDIGSASIGWAVLPSVQGEPVAIGPIGVHCFDAGVEGDLESGKEASRAAVRREARLPRRQTWRRARRRMKVLRLLQLAGLIPSGELKRPQDVHELIAGLDKQLRSAFCPAKDARAAHLMPFLIRKAALTDKLEPFAFGRAIYHLAQRRGYLSNRKADRSKDDDTGKVAGGIEQLSKDIEKSGAATLGAYFATLDPCVERIRSRYTSRAMYKHEFEAIWTAQAAFHLSLTSELKKELYKAIFFQRPLRSQKNLVGHCSLMPECKRAPLALRIAQRFRLLQKVNDLKIDESDGVRRDLTDEQRATVLCLLTRKQDIKFTTLRGKQGLKLPAGSKFNLEEGGEEKIIGHRTDSELRSVFGTAWDSMSNEGKDHIVEDVLSFEKTEPLVSHAKRAWGLSQEKAKELGSITLEPGYSMHCREALRRLVVRMESGMSYMTARQLEFPESFKAQESQDQLPPVREALPDLRNPAVCRALTEVRKLVNTIIRKYGKPEKIRIELARDLKQPRKQREQIWKRNRQNQKLREAAVARLLKDMNISRPSGQDIEKVLLAEECGWECPYTGRTICMRTLVGESSQFDVEHIWPFSRSMDNSFVNKTLCYHEENRNRKGKLMPSEAYSSDPIRWKEMLGRVQAFHGEAAGEKLRRFRAEEIPEGFTQRQLQDTRYASRLAGDYMALLYGGRADEDGQRIETRPGGLTAHIRRELMLNAILGDPNKKSRATHLHHAVDAVAIALASTGMVQQFQLAAEKARTDGRRLFSPIREPWSQFIEQVRGAVERIRVSCRPSRGIGGGLHADSFYSKPVAGENGDNVRHIRKALGKLSTKEIENDAIVDLVVRQAVKEAWLKAGGGDPAKVFAEPKNHPTLKTRDGGSIPIHKARIKARVKPRAIGRDERVRHVAPAPGSNHHAVIVVVLDKNGGEKCWEDHTVNRLGVYERKSNRQPIIQQDWGTDRKFKFSLARNDYLAMQDDKGEEQIYRVASVSDGDIELKLHYEARTDKELKTAKARVRVSGEKLFKRKARKIFVNYLGEVYPAND